MNAIHKILHDLQGSLAIFQGLAQLDLISLKPTELQELQKACKESVARMKSAVERLRNDFPVAKTE